MIYASLVVSLAATAIALYVLATGRAARRQAEARHDTLDHDYRSTKKRLDDAVAALRVLRVETYKAQGLLKVKKPFVILPGCIACTECLPVCPEDCIVPDTEIYDILPDLCTGCYKCARVCPVDVCVPYHKVPTQALVRAPSYLAGLRVDVSPGTSSVRKLGGKER